MTQKNFQYFILEVILIKFQLPRSWSLYGAGGLTKFRNHILGVYTVTQLLREKSFGLGLDLELIPPAQRCSVSLPNQRRNRSVKHPSYSDGGWGESKCSFRLLGLTEMASRNLCSFAKWFSHPLNSKCPGEEAYLGTLGDSPHQYQSMAYHDLQAKPWSPTHIPARCLKINSRFWSWVVFLHVNLTHSSWRSEALARAHITNSWQPPNFSLSLVYDYTWGTKALITETLG